MARWAKVIGWNIEWTGTGLTVFRGSFTRITIVTRETFIAVWATCVVLTVQAFPSDVITGFGMTEALTWFTDATKNSSIHSSVLRPARFARGARVSRRTLTNFHSCGKASVSRIGHRRFKAHRAQPEDGIHPKAVRDLYEDSLQIRKHCHQLSSTDWGICAMNGKQFFFK